MQAKPDMAKGDNQDLCMAVIYKSWARQHEPWLEDFLEEGCSSNYNMGVISFHENCYGSFCILNSIIFVIGEW